MTTRNEAIAVNRQKKSNIDLRLVLFSHAIINVLNNYSNALILVREILFSIKFFN